ncbi:3-isopropylmalate dehydratase small subunit [Candidatus Gottesmanbacteria bacterium RIFCSPLOWO2_01_FULL_39_12b]|uniref:3-isopropylmalate dehydratase small subunit n=1 Tax=Candidatus Gottesmanbacteria bacterium RIFCSPLOWO2_01_FULL_39_12b TaxID=1798388 RepID=A0A1F6ANV5_9BACT|nr:MAG: 3-isopropylmalate dehydratase small subunit [Candidatus Gottesmanbacteria bacterium RIFCSPLOWO2_01_FULL_39_12b]
MRKFIKLASTCLSMPTENIDTDQIIPARFLKTTERKGLGKYLFYNWRGKHFDESIHRGKKILIAGNNFGCGSSREHAVWALMDFGFEAVISSSYGDIFYNNSLKNGFLPVILKAGEIQKIFNLIEQNPKVNLTIDLQKQTVVAYPLLFSFPIDSFRKNCLLKGVDELGYILSYEKEITRYELSPQSLNIL